MTEVHPSAVIHEKCQLGQDVVIGPNCVLEEGVSVGDGSILGANVVVGRNVKIGRNNDIFANSMIGGRPQILNAGPDFEYGGLIIADNNTIREQVTIHPSIYREQTTRMGNDNLLMIGVHIGHDCILENKIVMSNYVQISGHCKIETGVWLSGMVLLHQFVTLGKWCYAAGMAGVNHDVPPFLTVSGHYPPRIRSVNKRGMQRAGLSERQQQEVQRAFRLLYRGNDRMPLLKRAKKLISEDGLDENVRCILETILKSGEHRFGRYLETLRHD